ncbi:J domain-containing protein [Bradyrhizobium sp.]|jgi:hypothetical protein|uniref:J domain-containing protein n=1 Tax=Bradyrhizobium sp. TaxID=376 RepID=UPI002C96AC50|nr:J domain-containing protein [Bradyrhizobium sp.]HWX64032.1 J domain-containing protein [Bradyrhizobium sp.]
MKTLYELLGVGPDASDEAVKMAYRKLAKIHHPDLNPNDPDAARRFRQVSAAIAILCDAKRRAAYDQRLVRELQRRLDREIEWHRLEWPRLLAISAAAGGVIGVVAVTGSILIGPVSPTSVFASATTRDAVHSPLSILAAPQESARRERSIDKIPSLPAIVLPASTSADDRGAVAARPEQHCKQQTGSGLSREGNGPARLDVAGIEAEPRCETPKGREADERGLNANERAALIRQAQELLASGDTRTARAMMQRACRNSPSRCGPSSREEL